MGIFDFLKKILWEDETKEAGKTGKEKLAFSEIAKWTENKNKEIEDREKKTFALIQETINSLTSELKGKILILKNVDVESRKAEDKLKSLTEEGRTKYLGFVDSLLEELNELKEDKLEKTVNKINKSFSNFNKNSHMSYERATILIGKEMGEIREGLKTFSKEIVKIFEENKGIIDISKAISDVDLKHRQFGKIESEINEANEFVISLDREVNNREDENKKILEETENIKKTPEYLDYLNRLEKVKSLEQEVEKGINNLRQIIDFKTLASFYHIFEKEMEVLKMHKDNFQISFQKDNGKSILELLEQAKLNTGEISERINQIRSKKEEIVKRKMEIMEIKNPIQELVSKMEKITLEIENLNTEKSKKQKHIEKLGANKVGVINNIKEELEKINVEVEV